MSAIKTIDVSSPVQVRIAGLEALKRELGVIGAVRFLQQYDSGYGDYSKEKYSIDEDDMETICNKLSSY